MSQTVVLPNKSRPPGPKGHLVSGHMTEFQRDPLEFMTRCAREHGDIVWMRFIYVPCYFLFHPDHTEYVLVTNNRNFIKPISFRTPFFQRVAGNGLLTSEGDFWRRQRRLAQPAFHRERIAGYGQTMVECAERLTRGWQAGETRDIYRDMMHLTMEIVGRTLFSVDVSGEADELGQQLKTIIEPFARQATYKWILDNRLPTPGNRRFHRTAALLDRFIYRLISERRARGEDTGDLLSLLLHAQDEDGERMNDKQLRDEAVTLFFAGQETTATALGWAWYLLGQHPEAERKLATELAEVLDGRAPTVADLPRLRYTEMVAKEVLRLYPPAWAMGREAINDCEIGGYHVRAGSQIFMSQWVTQRDPRFFERPDEFLPERWASEAINSLPKYAYFPFGGGPRLCIGNTFAMMEIVLTIAAIAQRFRFSLVPDHQVTLFPALSLRPRDGIKVTVQKR